MSAARKLALQNSLPDHAEVWIVSRSVDWLMIGGLSIVAFLVISVLFARSTPDPAVGMFVFNLSFLVNFPHFLVSYQLLYGDFGKEIPRNGRFFWAAVVVPILLAGVMIAAYAMGSSDLFGYLLNSMYFFVGWHYVKQTFGAVMVTNTMNKTFYTPIERFWLKASLYNLWVVSFIAMNVGFSAYNQMGVRYYSLNFPKWPLDAAYGALFFTVGGVVVTHLQKFVREGKWPTMSAVIAYGTIFLWLIPAASHPMYAHMMPAFHSLQYLLFVYAFRRNKVEAQISEPKTPEGRAQWLTGIWGYLLGAVTLGALSFYLIPTSIDQLGFLNTVLVGATPAVFFATIFINIHHYFIDNVLWRGQNPEMRKHLFRA